ncbi:formate dehydrogenase, partial [Saccharothrix sp. ST-888]
MLVCLATAGCLYFPPLAELVGRRRLVVTVHEW